MLSKARTSKAEKAAGMSDCSRSLTTLLLPGTRMKATGALAGAGTLAGGTAGGSAGAVVGAACGVVPALFTFGLSIPVGAVVGAVAGTTAGSSFGALLGGATGYIGFTYKREIKDVAKKASKAAENGKEYALYIVDVQMWKLRGEAFYSGRYMQKDGSRCPMIQAFGANTFTKLPDVYARLADLDAQHHRGDVVRHNWLGPTKLASSVFVDGIFSLGTSPEDHQMCREFLDQSLWGNERQWDEAQVLAAAQAFVEKKRVLKMPSAAKEFAVSFMAESWLGLSVWEFDPRKFRKYQDNRFLMSMAPDMLLKLPLVRKLVDNLVTKEDEEYIAMVSSAIQRKYPSLVAGKNPRMLAASALDALTFAGGLSVGEITARVLAGLWNKHGDLGAENFSLKRSNIDEVILETCRLFPAVSNVAYDRKKPFGRGEGPQVTGREILAIGPVMQDPESWGKDAAEFRLRGAQAYKKQACCPFAEGAVHRMCPGKDLAISMVRALVLEINSRKWQVQRQWIHTLPLPGPVHIPCGVGRTKVWFFGYSNEDFTVEFLR